MDDLQFQSAGTDRPRRAFKHPCPDCDRQFTCKHNVEQHQREKHTLERPYSCEICNAAFCRPYTRNRHVRTKHGTAIGPGRGRVRRNYAKPGFAPGDTAHSFRPTPQVSMPIFYEQGVSEIKSAVTHPQTRYQKPPTTNEPGVKFGRCSPCNILFRNKDELLVHMHLSHGQSFSQFCTCPICLARFPAETHAAVVLFNEMQVESKPVRHSCPMENVLLGSFGPPRRDTQSTHPPSLVNPTTASHESGVKHSCDLETQQTYFTFDDMGHCTGIADQVNDLPSLPDFDFSDFMIDPELPGASSNFTDAVIDDFNDCGTYLAENSFS